jgi:hypothetical protein
VATHRTSVYPHNKHPLKLDTIPKTTPTFLLIRPRRSKLNSRRTSRSNHMLYRNRRLKLSPNNHHNLRSINTRPTRCLFRTRQSNRSLRSSSLNQPLP